jgi:hypothetical protein
MPTLYYKPVVDNNWATAANWFTNAAATISAGTILADTAPWLADNVFKTYDLAFATNVTVSPITGDATGSPGIGNGFTITGTCSIPVVLGLYDSEGSSLITVYGGTYSAGVALSSAIISGGTFQSTVSIINYGTISGGTFQGAITGTTVNASIAGGLFSNTVTLSGAISLSAGVFNGAVNVSNTLGGSGVTGGTFNSGFTQTAGNITGGTFNGTYTRVAGNVTGGTFNNGIMYQFYRNGFPPPIAFGGYNTKALDVLGTGLV